MTRISNSTPGSKTKSSLQHKVVIGLLLGLAVVILNFAMGIYQILQVNNMRLLVTCSHSLFRELDGLLLSINDTQGHDAGSAALAAIALVLTQKFRDHDLVARWGGDEIVVLAASKSPGFEDTLSERIEAALKQKLKKENLPCELSVSTGVLSVDADKADIAQIEELIAVADERRYEQKLRKRKARE